jgi:hypothetical protein
MRNKKISADISVEAKLALDEYSDKHDRSKSWLINRMILKFCSIPDVNDTDIVDIKQVAEIKPKAPVKRFAKPYLTDVVHYMEERVCSDPVTQAEKFCDFYESNGWKVGKNKMKCWKAAVRNWLKGNGNGQSNKANNASSNQKESSHERIKRENRAKYAQPDECRLGMGADDRHLGGAVGKGERCETIEHVDNSAFIDYE